jgi:preprotein translocase subunit YajC
VEIAPGTRVKVVRHMIADVRSKSQPVSEAKPA